MYNAETVNTCSQKVVVKKYFLSQRAWIYVKSYYTTPGIGIQAP